MMDEFEKKIKYLMLSNIRGIGPVGQHKLLKILGDDWVYFDDRIDIKSLLEARGCTRRCMELFINNRNDPVLRAEAEQIVIACDRKGIDIVTASDPVYPVRFLRIPQMPKVLYTKGSLGLNHFETSVGVIGARRCSREGKNEAIRVAKEAVKAGKAVISGMAKGIDSYAHTAAINSGGYTIAVLGNGPDICYPEEHQKLYERICETGCVISEVPPGIKPRQFMFPRRNRMIAVLSDELYVIDAGRNSGTGSTVEAATKHSRKVWYINRGTVSN